MDQPHRPGQLSSGFLGVAYVGSVGLVDRQDVSELQDTSFDALQLIACTREREETEAVDHVGDRDLGLADPDRLDQDDVEARRLEQHDRLASRLGDSAQRDRKSTRLNSSHVAISYAVFCLKKN